MSLYCLALDLKNDPQLIAEYEAHHQKVWPEIIEGIKAVGLANMQIFRVENRLFMMIEADENIDFDKQMKTLATLPRQQEWEALMWKYQQALPGAKEGEKWILMKKIFNLAEY